MKTFYDGLIFDDRDNRDLFADNNPGQPSYADIVKRWVSGNYIPKEEQKIVSYILISYPDYILKNGKAEEFIELIHDSLKQPKLQNPGNPEKGLFLYTLFYFYLKSAEYKQALQVLWDLEDVIRGYGNSHLQILRSSASTLSDDILHPQEIRSDETTRLQESYFEIISRILDTKELALLEPDFNLDRLPLPDKTLSPASCRDLRGNALYLYEKKLFREAKRIYQRLLMEKFELPGTLIHLARIELTAGNKDQAEVNVIMAWRHHVNAPQYVMARILWFRLCLSMLEKGNRIEIPVITEQIKTLIQKRETIMQWSMQQLMEQLKPGLLQNDYNLLTALVDSLSNG